MLGSLVVSRGEREMKREVNGSFSFATGRVVVAIIQN